ncbi:MAG: hypothetical protein ABI569_16680 [Casimicrobiaceae bacterium]
MRALKVRINDQTPVTAGAADLGVLSVIVTCVGKLGPDAVSPRGSEADELKIDLGGLTSRPADSVNENFEWLPGVPVKVGDKITVEILETEHVDPVDRAEHVKRRESGAKEYYEHCKETYFKLRSHYEPEA